MKVYVAILVIAVIAAAALATSYYMPINEYMADPYHCVTASDCVPEQCCHPTSCVNRNNAPDCSGIMCT